MRLGIQFLALLLGWAGPAQAQEEEAVESPTPTVSPEAARAEIQKNREANQTQLAAVERAREALPADATVPETLVREVDLLKQIDGTFGRQLSELQRAEEATAADRQFTMELADLQAAVGGAPSTFQTLETIRDELMSMNRRVASNTAAEEIARTGVATAREAFEEQERRRRAAKEALERTEAPEEREATQRALRIVELESQLAAETVVLRDLELVNVRIEGSATQHRLALLTERERRARLSAQFSRQELDDQLERIATEEAAVRRRLESARRDLDYADAALGKVRARRDQTADPTVELTEELEAARLRREARQVQATLLGDALEWLTMMRETWTERFDVFNRRATDAEERKWLADVRADQERLGLASRILTDEVAELRKTLVSLQAKVVTTKETDPTASKWLRDQERELSEQIRLREAGIQRIEEASQLNRRHESDLAAEIESVTWPERVQEFWRATTELWNYEITSVDDSPITVAKVVKGLLLLIMGSTLARWMTGLIGGRLLPRLGVNEGAAAALQTILFYVLVISVGLVALRMVNVPLTAFTILGGALAIGVGFGSQNLMNNFISGLILLVERPIRVGDLIDVENVLGVVEHIGLRSTRVKKPTNVDIIVPNSTFLQSNVVNWTLSDDRYRTFVSVGVAYGSSTREVSRLLLRAVEEHGRVLEKPSPIVLFTEFGDNALQFEIHFWIRMRRDMDRRTIESDIRHRVDGLFDDAGVTIAFPQRDVHIDTSQPLSVRVLADGVTVSDTTKAETARFLP